MRLNQVLAATMTVLTVAGLAQGAQTVFLNSDGNRLYRSFPNGTVEPVYVQNTTIIGMTVLPAHAHVNGAGPGDVIAVSGDPDQFGMRAVYRVDNAAAGVPNLVQIGNTNNTGLSSMTFAGGKMYGLSGTGGAGGQLILHELDASFNVVFTYNMNVSQTGHGGISYDTNTGKFFTSTSAGDKLQDYILGGSAADVGLAGLDFRNQGLEFHQGTLFGVVHRVSDSNLVLGSFDLNSGAFTPSFVVAGSQDQDIGFVAIPAPGSVALLGLAGLIAGRRRR